MALTLNGTTGIAGIAGSAGTPALQGNNDTNTGYFFTTDTLGLSTAGSERLRITSDGKVGINRTTPTAPITARRLDAGGTGTNGVIAEFANNGGYGVWFGQSSASGASWGATTGDFYWCTGGLSSQTERLRITSAGKVGIGTASPSSFLTVTGSEGSQYSGSFTNTSTQGWGLFVKGGADADDYSLRVQNKDATELLSVRSNGKIAIGEHDPDGNTFLIRAASTAGTNKGHIMLTGDSATNGQGPQIVFSESGSGSSFAGAYIGHTREGSNSVGTLVFGTRATGGDANTTPTERLRINSSGNVGIGNTSPGELLSLRHATSNTVLDFECLAANDGTTGNIIKFRGKGANGVSYHASQIKGITENGANNAGFLSFWTNSAGTVAERLRITSGGDVLIGRTTTSTSHTLCVQADSTAEAIVICGRSADDIGELAFFENDSSTRLGEVQYRQDHVNIRHRVGDIRFATAGTTEKCRIGTGTGSYFMIGTTNNRVTGNSFNYPTLGIQHTDTGYNSIGINQIRPNMAGVLFKGYQQSSGNYYGTYYVDSNSQVCGYVTVNTSNQTVSYTNSSDYRLKQNDVPISNGIARVKQLRPIRFKWKSDLSEQDGFFAHEVQAVVPEAVTGEKDAMMDTAERAGPHTIDSTKIAPQQLDTRHMVPLLTAALKEAITKIETLETKVAALESA